MEFLAALGPFGPLYSQKVKDSWAALCICLKSKINIFETVQVVKKNAVMPGI